MMEDRHMIIDEEYIDGPAIHELALLLDIDLTSANGYVVRLWKWARRYTCDAVINVYDERIVAAAAQWKGSAEAFTAALLDCGLVDEDGKLAGTDRIIGRR